MESHKEKKEEVETKKGSKNNVGKEDNNKSNKMDEEVAKRIIGDKAEVPQDVLAVSRSVNKVDSFFVSMENFCEEYKHYWETKLFLQTQELDSWGLDEALSVYYDSSSPDGPTSPPPATSKNIVSERKRRKKHNERLFALRSVVPNISKMDKASTIKDAIEYIQHLHQEEKNIKAEIMELESEVLMMNPHYDFEQDLPMLLRSKNNKTEHQLYHSITPTISPIEILELRVTYMGEKTIVVNLRCRKRTDTMLKLCQVFESLKLKVITANITSFSATLLMTAFIQGDEEEKDLLYIKIQTAIAALNDPLSPISI